MVFEAVVCTPKRAMGVGGWTINLARAKAHLREILDRVEAGEEVAHVRRAVAEKRAVPVEKLAAFRTHLPRRGKDSATLVREMREAERY